MNIEKLSTRYAVGSASVDAEGTIVTPTDAMWSGNVWGDDLFFDPAQPLVPPQRIEAVNEDGTLTLAFPWPGDAMDEAPYEVRYIGIIERSTAQTRKVLEQLGEVSAYYDVQVDTLADRDAFDARPAGFRILVSDIGDGRAAIYSKASSVEADWTDPAMFSGPIGLTPEVTVGTVTTGDPGTEADITETPTESGVELNFTIPAGEGFSAKGDYDSGTAYAKGDVVQQMGSSWIALQATTGNAPPSLPTTSDAYWQLLARRGVDGAGAVTALVGGTGIAVDSTDPSMPEISANLANQSEAEAGADNAKLMTPLSTAQAIAAQVPNFDPSELWLTVSLLALQVSDNTNVALFLGGEGNRVADSFDDLSYVDTVNSTGLDTSVPGLLKPTVEPDTYSVMSDPPLTTDAAGQGNIARRQVILASALNDVSGDRVRITFAAPSVGSFAVSEAFVGRMGGAAPNFDGGQVRLTFGGNNGFSISAGQTIVSDPASLSLNGTQDIVISFFVTGSSGLRYNPGFPSSVSDYTKNGASTESGDTSVSGYVPSSGQLAAIDKIEVRSSAGYVDNMVAYLGPFTASLAPEKAKTLLRVKEVEAAQAGLDYRAWASRDNKLTWTEINLTELFTSPSPTPDIRIVDGAETDISGQPSGTAVWFCLSTHTNKMIEFHDAYSYWK